MVSSVADRDVSRRPSADPIPGQHMQRKALLVG